MKRRFKPRFQSRSGPAHRINGKIRAREVRVIDADGNQIGIRSLADAIQLARAHGVDLVEIAPTATPPVCRLVDYRRFLYEQAKREKESKANVRARHAGKVKEVQLSVSIDHHDFATKVARAAGFLCEDMKVKASLRFRGREMAHQERGFQVIERFLEELAPFGRPDAPPKQFGRNVNIILTPLPANKRAKNPKEEVPTTGEVEETAQRPPHPNGESHPPNASPDTGPPPA